MTARALTVSAEQQRIVDAPLEGPTLVNAGAGTGKTHALVARAVHVIGSGKVAPERLLLVTFTRTAAAEITARIDGAFGSSIRERPVVGTFHAIAAQLLRECSFAAGISPDCAAVDDARARAVFGRAFAQARSGLPGVDATCMPFLERSDVLERDLATLALRLMSLGRSVDDFESMALAAADTLERLPFGALHTLTGGGKIAKNTIPREPRSADERFAEARAERANVRFVAALLRHYEALMAAESLLTYGALIRRALDMIQCHPQIARTLGARFAHAIVDEFQDTNADQIALLEAIFGRDLQRVMAVGDVRQSIFEFAGADPHGIIAFAARSGCRQIDLTTSRRSYLPILELSSAVVAKAAGIPASFHTPPATVRPAPSVPCVYVETFADAPAEAAAIAETIVRLGVRASDCAILLRSRRRALAYAAALNARGLAVSLSGGAGFFEAPEIREVLGWMRLAVDPGDPRAIVTVLRGAAVALGDGTIAWLAATGRLAERAMCAQLPSELGACERERLARFREVARGVRAFRDAPVADAVRAIVTASGALFARWNDGDRFAQARANLDKLVALAIDFAGDRPLAHLTELLEDIRVRDELEIELPPAELEGDRVTISTIHRAKGLEWPYVFVADISPVTFPSTNAGNNDVVVKYDPDSGALALKHAVDGRPTLRSFIIDRPHTVDGLELPRSPRDREEERRLLYVALTRAQEAVFCTGRTPGGRTSDFIDDIVEWASAQGRAGHQLQLSAAGPRATPETDVARPVSDPLPLLELRAQRRRGERRERERRRLLSVTAVDRYERCPRRAHLRDVVGLAEIPDDTDVEGGLHERAERIPVRYGRVVHTALETLMQARLDSGAADLLAAVEDAVEEHDGSPRERNDALRDVAAACSALASWTPLSVETEFAVDIDGVTVHGFVDLVARDPDGRLTVVDYKTGNPPEAATSLQFAVYRAAVAERWGEMPNAVIVRIGDPCDVHEVTVCSDDDRARRLADAALHRSAEPRPGAHCRFCPYAGDVCEAAQPAPLSAAS